MKTVLYSHILLSYKMVEDAVSGCVVEEIEVAVGEDEINNTRSIGTQTEITSYVDRSVQVCKKKVT